MFVASLLTLAVAHVLALPPLITDEGSVANMPPPIPEYSLPLEASDLEGARRVEGVIAVGDMLFTPESYRNWVSAGRSYLMPPYNQWYKDSAGFPVVPYVIDPALSSAEATVVLNGINQWTGTCIKFVNNTVYNFTNYVKIVKPATNGQCNSYVGNANFGSTGQPLNLGAGCYSSNIVAHEVGHAIGLSHEHNRADRDQYLNVYTNNILSGYSSNFNLDQAYFSTQSVPYNYLSVMHYFWNAFSSNNNLPTMLPKDPTMQVYLMANNPVTHYDTLLVNRAMNCSALWAKSCVNPPTCLNNGYLSKACTCVCPTGTSGTDCGTKTAASFPVYPTNYTNYQCGGTITAATTGLSAPLYNAAYPARTAQAECIWWIKKPSTAASAKVTFKSFNMFRKEADGSCYYEFLEVRTSSLYLADARKCATDYSAGSVITSSGDIVLWFESRVYPGGNTGFTFDVSFA